MGEARRSRWSAVVALVAVCPFCWMTGCKPEMPPEPPRDYNVVLVSIDTLRADRLNCHGYREREVSPDIDALAGDGVLFENYIAASPWTTPAHLSLLTSLSPSAHRVLRCFEELRNDLSVRGTMDGLPDVRTTLAKVLRDEGYRTAAFTGGGTMDEAIGFGQGFELYDQSMFKLNSLNTEAMFRWIRERGDEQFFLFWHSFEVHAPYTRPHFLSEVLPGATATQISEEIRELARPLRWRTPDFQEHDAMNIRHANVLQRHDAYTPEVSEALYTGGIREADRWLGRLIGLLRALGLYDRKLIVFTSDHGEEFADRTPHDFYNRHGHTVYDEMVRVPLILKLPNQQYAGTRVANQARKIDVMPTILDVLGVRLAESQMQGVSLRAMWVSPAQQEERLAVTEALARRNEKKSVRTGRYKLLFSIDEQTVIWHGRRHMPKTAKRLELYDLKTDPHEQRDIMVSHNAEAMAPMVDSLKGYLREHVRVDGPAARQVRLDEATITDLRALGYVE
ncbi:MAG: sulfatase-like hydrolase/transferase [Phycisphaerales bacterium]|nr:MAG: sulfatase-like hydrolase/transferase [Phycisphaerales bacterium]